MRVSLCRVGVWIACVFIAPVQSFAADGSYLCAVSEVYECVAVTGCKRAAPQEINLPTFIIVDIDNKQLKSAVMGADGREEDVEGITVTDKSVFLHGTQDEETWNATVSLETGALTGGITSGPSSFTVFGNCTSKR